jgi:hypothetical protein
MNEFERQTLERFRLVSAQELADISVLPPEPCIEPFLPLGDIALLAAARGIGKTQVAMGLAVAAATGSGFLRFNCPKTRRVTYLDGEMNTPLMQRRYREALGRLPANVSPPAHLHFLFPDMCLDGVTPNLALEEGQAAVDVLLQATGTELLIIDNIACLFRSGLSENESMSWQGAPQQWLISLKSRGLAILLVHHLGKNGEQRGTSAREDILGASLRLRRPSDYEAEQGCRFELEYTKARNLAGGDAGGFAAALIDGRWHVEGKAAPTLASVLELRRGGLSTRDIAESVGTSKSTVARLLASAKGGGNA